MIFDILRFNKDASNYYAKEILNSHAPDLISIEDYVKKNQYSKTFTEYYLIPLGAALWSASREEMRNFPLNFFIRFFHNHGMLTVDDRPSWQVIKGGSNSYIPKIIKSYEKNIHLNSKVLSLKRNSSSIQVNTSTESHEFDHVVVATHADQAWNFLTTPFANEIEILTKFKYRPNDVLLHTDTSVLPRSKKGWASWNYFIPKTEKERVCVTYNMNILQSINSEKTFLVSLNMDDIIDPSKVIKKIPYMHPIFNLEASNAQKRWIQISGKDRIHYAGAYWGNGFHEDGVRSAFNVATSMGAI